MFVFIPGGGQHLPVLPRDYTAEFNTWEYAIKSNYFSYRHFFRQTEISLSSKV